VYLDTYKNMVGRWWHSWLRHCATRQEVLGSILDRVLGKFSGDLFLLFTQPQWLVRRADDSAILVVPNVKVGSPTFHIHSESS
jgi:hypothetical protein